MRISVVTACRNAILTIDQCRRSVKTQSFAAEHVFVEGAAPDGTAHWLAELAARDSSIRFISEPDRGLYDAMNKGFRLCTGEVIGTLNADDHYADTEVLKHVADVMSDPEIGACYGDLVFIDPDVSLSASPDVAPEGQMVRFWKAGPQGQNWSHQPPASIPVFLQFANPWLWGWMPPHPTLFVRRNLIEKFGDFRLDLGTSADYEFMLRLLCKHRVRCAYIPRVQVRMSIGGVSTRSIQNRLAAHLNDWKAWRINGLIPMPWTLPMKPLRKIHQWVDHSP